MAEEQKKNLKEIKNKIVKDESNTDITLDITTELLQK